MSKHGENIRKRKDGRWEGRYIKGRKSDRTAIWGYIYGHSYTEVKEKLSIKKMEVHQFALNVENPTFSELSLTWESSIFLGVKSSTAAHYHYTLQHYILPVLGPYRVQALNESILESSLLEIIAPVDQNHKVLGNAMSKECLTLVRRICRYAVHLHIMRPIEIDFKLPTVNPSNTTVLNNLEQKSVCAYVRSSPTPRRLGMLLMMQMGLRIGEVCGLQWGDFDLQNGVLSVRRTVKRIYMAPGKTTLVTQSPKTQSSERDIANALMEQEVAVCMTNFARIMNELNNAFSGRNEVVDRLCGYPLLVIDDFGMERGTEYALEQIYNIIDSRYRSRKPLIVTTNLTMTELKNPQDTAHARIYDRLLELCTPIACTGPSMRKDIGQAKLDLLKTLLA